MRLLPDAAGRDGQASPSRLLPRGVFQRLDPCAGEGVALAGFAAGAPAVTYGIELDRRRTSKARARPARRLLLNSTPLRSKGRPHHSAAVPHPTHVVRERVPSLQQPESVAGDEAGQARPPPMDDNLVAAVSIRGL